MTAYQTQPELVEAFQMTHEHRESVHGWPDWMMVSLVRDKDVEGAIFPLVHMDLNKELVLRFSGCDVLIHWDSWIVRWPDGDLEVYYPEQFAAKFEPVPHKSATYTAITGNRSTADLSFADLSFAELMKRNMDQFHRTFAGPWTCAGMTTTAEPGPYSWKPSVMVSEDDLARWDKEIGWLKNLAEARRKDLDNLTRTNRKQSAEINRLKELLVGKDALITRQNAAVVAKSAEITRQSAEIIRLRKIVDDLQSHSFALAVEVANRNESFARLRESLGRFLYLGWRPDHPSYKVAARLAREALTEGC